jgi:hypothetical protein
MRKLAGDTQGILFFIPVILLIVGIAIGVAIRMMVLSGLTGLALTIAVIGLAFFFGLMAILIKSGIVDALLVGSIIGLFVMALIEGG